MLRRSLLVTFAALVVTGAAAAQERPAEPKRGAYVVKHAAAKDVAAALAKHFQGAADVLAGPEGPSNVVLVSAAPAVYDEVMKVAELLDRRPRTVAVDVFIVVLPAPKAGGKEPPPVDEKELTGAIDDVAKALAAMQKRGQVAAVQRIGLTGQEGQAATCRLGESKPYTTGISAAAGGPFARFISYRNVGTQVQVTPQVAADKTVTLDLRVDVSRMVVPEEGAAVGADEKGNAVNAPEMTRLQLASKAAVAPGKAVRVKDASPAGKSSPAEVLIVVGARVVESK